MKKINSEKRYVQDDAASIRMVTEDDGRRFIEGYPIIFNKRSVVLNERGRTFREVIKPSAVEKVFKRADLDIKMTFDHDTHVPMARYRSTRESNTLSYSVDKTGVFCRFEVPDTTLGNDVAKMIERGDVDGMSFIFTIADEGDKWTRTANNEWEREITAFDNLYDFSVVADPAYEDTDVAVMQRAANKLIKEEETEQRAASLGTPIRDLIDLSRDGSYSISVSVRNGEIKNAYLDTYKYLQVEDIPEDRSNDLDLSPEEMFDLSVDGYYRVSVYVQDGEVAYAVASSTQSMDWRQELEQDQDDLDAI